MELFLKRIKAALAVLGAAFLAGLSFFMEPVLAEERGEESSQEEVQEIYPLVYGEWPGRKEAVLILKEEEQEYRVLPGDCLWNISEKLWGDGRWYDRLLTGDGEEIEDLNLIYPGMTLRAAQEGYICKRDTQNTGMKMGEYSMDMPGNWTVGTISSGDASANFVLSGDGFQKILCLIQDKKEETVVAAGDWEACAEKIRSYAEQRYGENVSGLTFEHYRMGQEDEIYLYSFLWQVELPVQNEVERVKIRVCMGLKLTEHIQAEFLGFAGQYDIHGGVRYTTASFEENMEDSDPETFTVNDSNMSILPQAEWELEGMYDPFLWVEEFFGSLSGRTTQEETEPEAERVRDRVMERVERAGGRR